MRQKLFTSGLVTSNSVAYGFLREFQLRFNRPQRNLPNLSLLQDILTHELNYLSRIQLYFVYLYNSDRHVRAFIEYLKDVYNNNMERAEITRQRMYTALKTLAKQWDYDYAEKSYQNWIGKMIYTLQDVQIMTKIGTHRYLIHFGPPNMELFVIFMLFNKIYEISCERSPFFHVYNIGPIRHMELIQEVSKYYPQLRIEITEEKPRRSVLLKETHNYLSTNIIPSYTHLTSYLSDLYAK